MLKTQNTYVTFAMQNRFSSMLGLRGDSTRKRRVPQCLALVYLEQNRSQCPERTTMVIKMK